MHFIRHLSLRWALAGVFALAWTAGSGPQTLGAAEHQTEEASQEAGTGSEGIYLAFSRTRTSLGPLRIAVNTLVGALEYATFSIIAESRNNGPAEFAVHASGMFASTNPVAGSGRWRGQAVGYDLSRCASRGNPILGDAEITLEDFANPRLNVRLSQLHDMATGAKRADMQWNDVSVEGGAFSALDEDSSLVGRFYGPNHEEVVGTFKGNDILGAFGAGREDVGSDPAPAEELPTTAIVEPAASGATDLALIEARFDIGAIFRVGEASFSRVHTSFSGDGDPVPYSGQTDIYSIWLSGSHGFAFRRGIDLSGPLAGGAGAGGSLDSAVTYSGGLATSATPLTGSATWLGAMTGMDPADPATEVRGDAKISIADFANPAASVEFTNIREFGTMKQRPNVSWSSVPINRGAFRDKNAFGWIHGRFHGESQEEVTGTFSRSSMTGTFGAYRTDAATGTDEGLAAGLAGFISSHSFSAIGHVSGTRTTSAGADGWLADAAESAGSESTVFETAQWAYLVAASGSQGPVRSLTMADDSQALPGLEAIVSRILDVPEDAEERDLRLAAGQLPNGAFGAERYDLRGADGGMMAYSAGFAFGHIAASNPTSGSANWSGEVFGFDVSGGDTAGNEIAGMVEITIRDFAAPALDVSFTGLRDMTLDAPRADMGWGAIPLDDGAFRSESLGSVIDGQIYGDDHSHIGGVFERNAIVGGFGAERVPLP